MSEVLSKHVLLSWGRGPQMEGIKALQSPETSGDAEAQLLGEGVLPAHPYWLPLDPGIPTALLSSWRDT